MSIEFSWHIKNQIAVARLSGKITRDDLTTGNETMTKWLAESDSVMVHLIFDATAMEGVAFSLSHSLTTLKYLRSPKMGCFLVYGVPQSYLRIVKFLGATISQLTRARFSTFDTLEEALAFIHRIDTTIAEPI